MSKVFQTLQATPSFADIICNAIQEVADYESNYFEIYINDKTITPKYLNSYLASKSELYIGFKNEGYNVEDDKDIINCLKDFETFNKITNADEFLSMCNKMKELRNKNNEFIENMIYNVYYLLIRPFIYILRHEGFNILHYKNNWYN